MKNLVDDLLERGETAIEKLLGRSESFNLEFKTKENPELFTLSKADKRNLGAALSAFSNADGGVLIFGVRTQIQDHIDVAYELCPIAEIARFKSEVHGRIDELIRPANPAVSTHVIECAEDSERGFLLLVIGKSENRPHMSMAPDHAKYFRRSFDQTLVMDHGLIRDLVMAPKEAVLVPDLKVLGRSSTGRLGKYVNQAQLEVHLLNTGQAMASMPYARIWINPPLQVQNVNNLALSSPRPDGGVAFYGSRDAVIHPADGVLFGAFSISFAVDQNGYNRAVKEGDLDGISSPEIWQFGRARGDQGEVLSGVFDELHMRLNVGAENAPTSEERRVITKTDLIALAIPTAVRGIQDINLKEKAMARALAHIEESFGSNEDLRLK